MEITEASEASSVEIALDFVKPFKSSSITAFTLTPKGDGTRDVDDDRTQDVHDQGDGRVQEHGQDDRPDFEKGLGHPKTLAEQQSTS